MFHHQVLSLPSEAYFASIRSQDTQRRVPRLLFRVLPTSAACGVHILSSTAATHVGFLLLSQVHWVLFPPHTKLLVNGVYNPCTRTTLSACSTHSHSLTAPPLVFSSTVISQSSPPWALRIGQVPFSLNRSSSFSLKTILCFSFLMLISVCIDYVYLLLFFRNLDSKWMKPSSNWLTQKPKEVGSHNWAARTGLACCLTRGAPFNNSGCKQQSGDSWGISGLWNDRIQGFKQCHQASLYVCPCLIHVCWFQFSVALLHVMAPSGFRFLFSKLQIQGGKIQRWITLL